MLASAAASCSSPVPRRDRNNRAPPEKKVACTLLERLREQKHWEEKREDELLLAGEKLELSSSQEIHSPPHGTHSFEHFRQHVTATMENPQSSTCVSALHAVIVVLIILSTLMAVLETVPELYDRYAAVFQIFELVFTCCFTVEILARACAAESLLGYLSCPSNIVDIIATSPWYIELGVRSFSPESNLNRVHKMAGSLRSLRMVRLVRMVRLLRVLRVAKVARHSEIISTVLESIIESLSGVLVLFGLVGAGALLSATMIYAVESDVPDGAFVSIPASFWWSLTTISTVGYGDLVPSTALGKIVGCLTMLSGILLVAVSVAVVTTTFTEHYQETARRHRVRRSAKNGAINQVPDVETSAVGRYSEASDGADLRVMWASLEEDVHRALKHIELELEARGQGQASFLLLDVLKQQAGTMFKSGESLLTHAMEPSEDPESNHGP
eukprot:TRINITY_DN30111_c0_g1_i1.p1 TRINITY_DN30111_c0_g1~~TRINITY_DN30111_c0_g1_i1.p1  ORF type:complete len:442 (-),score=38.10 TRINITY_DN30111_c0_g1_i1:284-1609(-)